MKQVKKAVKLFDWIEDKIIYLFCIMLFLIGLYALVDSYQVYLHANDDSLLKFKPGYNGEASDREIQGNMVAWLTIDGTNIDYPVMQGEDNNEYLNKDPYGDYSLGGSIFLDSRNSSDFSDGYSLIYGHPMEGGSMFGELHSFMEEDFFRKHRNAKLIVGDKKYDLKIFAALNTDATEEYIFAVTERKKKEVVNYVKKKAKICDGEIVRQIIKDKKRMVAMSTCKAPDSVERIVVFGVLE